MMNKRDNSPQILIILNGIWLLLIIVSILIISFSIAYPEKIARDVAVMDAPSHLLSLFKKPITTPPPITGSTIDESGNTIATVIVKAGEEVGRVRDDFYGVNTHGAYLGAGTRVDADGDGTTETNSDLEWHRKAFLDSGMKYMRWDANLQNYYFYNETNSSYYFKGNLSSRIEQLKWANENDIRVLLIMSYMPPWLADTSIEGCNLSKLAYCPPYDYDIWGNITLDYLNRITESGKYSRDVDIEVWNEPHGNFWLNELSHDDINKAKEYIKLYNVTYNAVKSKYQNISVGGPSGYTTSPIMSYSFLINFSNQMDFFSFHRYNNKKNQGTYEGIKTQIEDLLEICYEYNSNCSRIIISEFNVGHSYENILIKNSSLRSKEFAANIGLYYSAGLNKIPNKISMMVYQWSETKKYSPDTNYPEYPQRWSMVSEPPLDNAYYPSYNVTKDFAHYHAGGNMIVNSSSNNNSIKSVVSLNPQGIWHITVINTGTNNISVNIDVSSTGVESIKDLSNGKIYTISNGIANVGVLTEYDVKHYEGILDYGTKKNNLISIKSSSVDENKTINLENLNIPSDEFIDIQTDTNNTTLLNGIFVDAPTSSKDNKKEKFYGPIKSEEDLIERDYKSPTGSFSLMFSNKSNLIISIILLGSIICTAFIISIISKKKKRKTSKVKKLMNWVDRARALGYSNDKMKEMLAEYNWDKELVDKVVGK